LNKKLVGLGVGIVIMIVALVGMQSYKTVPDNMTNQTNTQQLPNTTLQKPLNTGKHITVNLTESMHFTVK
jgi:uncharacterized membrane protein